MPGLWTRIKTWSSTEDVVYSDLNAEFDNVLTYFVPLYMDDYSVDTTQMQVQTDPGEVGTESKATTLAGEIARLRFVINEIKGTTYWYTTASSSISELATSLGSSLTPNRISSGRMRTGSSQPIFLVPSGAALTVTAKGATTNLVYYIRSTQYTISTDVTNTSLVAAPSTNNTCLVNAPGFTGQAYTKTAGEYGSTIPIDTIGSEISTLNGKLCGFKVGTEYFIGRVDTSANVLDQCKRGYFFDSSDAAIPRVALSDNDTITLMKLTWIYATSAGALAAGYTNPTVGADQPSSPAVGDYWFDTTVNYWKYFDSASWVASGSILIGQTLQSSTVCVAARSFDFFKSFSNLNTISLERVSVTQVKTKSPFCRASVYGSEVRFQTSFATWDITADRDSGVSESANTTYYLYLTETGDRVISDILPMDFRETRGGLYHPHQAWLCVGQVENNNGSDLEALIDYNDGDRNNYKIVQYVGSSALNLRFCASPLNKFFFRNATVTVGERTIRYMPAPITITIPSTATMGLTSGSTGYIFGYLSDSAGCITPAVSSMWREDGLATVTLIDTSADDNGLYGTAGTTKPLISVARFLYSTAPNGTYSAIPDAAVLGYGKEILVDTYSEVIAGGDTATVNASTYYNVSSLTLTLQPGIYEIGYAGTILTDYVAGGSLSGSGNVVIRYNSTTLLSGSSRLLFTTLGATADEGQWTVSSQVQVTVTTTTTYLVSMQWSQASTASRLVFQGTGGTSGDAVIWARKKA